MKGVRAAARYAKAFLQLAKEQNATQAVIEDARMISRIVTESKELHLMLNSPLIKADKKGLALNKVFEGKVNGLTLNLINQVVKQNRENILPTIADQMIAQYNEANKIASVSVTTAIPLDASVKADLIGKLKEAYQLTDVELEEKIDTDLIGGMVLRMGDKQLDASIRRQLNDIKKELV
tara:strand:+ start:973 stop:1509 length:537 start_codon:yes stop_codon:yes gene_type:complete